MSPLFWASIHGNLTHVYNTYNLTHNIEKKKPLFNQVPVTLWKQRRLRLKQLVGNNLSLCYRSVGYNITVFPANFLNSSASIQVCISLYRPLDLEGICFFSIWRKLTFLSHIRHKLWWTQVYFSYTFTFLMKGSILCSWSNIITLGFKLELIPFRQASR